MDPVHQAVALIDPEDVAEDIVGLLPTSEQIQDAFRALAPRLLAVGFVVLLALFLSLVVRRVIRRFVGRVAGEEIDVAKAVQQKRAQTIADVLKTGATAIIWTIAILVVLDQFLDTGPLIAAVGIGGLALGFGAQNLVRDVIAGFFVLLEDQYHIGDVVEVAEVSGLVEKITLRTTVLRDLQGRRHVIPNGEIRVSSNFTKGFSRYVIDLPVPYEEDVDRVVEIVREVAEKMRTEEAYEDVILGPLEVLGVDDYAESQVTVKMFVDTVPGKHWLVGRELRGRIKRAYDEAGVSVPYPHREIIVKDGSLPSPRPSRAAGRKPNRRKPG